MPAKVKVTKEMIIQVAFDIARVTGAENINARTVSERLNCSTQPVMYHFATIEELKRAIYAKADCYHSEYGEELRGQKWILNYIFGKRERRAVYTSARERRGQHLF